MNITEEMAEESEQDRLALARLHLELEELLKHEDAMRVPVMVKRLVDGGVDPVVIAKTLLVGNRDGGALYRISARTAAIAHDEQLAELGLWFAIRDVDVIGATLMLTTGAVWLATQFSIDRSILRSFVAGDQPRREISADRRGCGALDLVDHGVMGRAWLVEAIDHAELPAYAPLELSLKR